MLIRKSGAHEEAGRAGGGIVQQDQPGAVKIDGGPCKQEPHACTVRASVILQAVHRMNDPGEFCWRGFRFVLKCTPVFSPRVCM